MLTDSGVFTEGNVYYCFFLVLAIIHVVQLFIYFRIFYVQLLPCSHR